MKLYSTNDKQNIVDLKEAVLNAFPVDKGLYMPCHIPTLPAEFLDNLSNYSFEEIGFQVSQNLIGDYIPEGDLYQLISRAINFPAPLVQLSEQISTLELWHGPTMAFKDFGARFMAELMSYFLKNEDRATTILVATSGDTGGAVAAGFYDVPGINVIILYPSGKVSKLQEQQLTTWGKNIRALEVEGVFDDCQRLVKTAFLDEDLKDKYSFSSANSINIARLLPQSFYYFEGYKQLRDKSKPIAYVVPSGNYGNLTAGMLAKKMGLDIDKFVAATNANKTVPDYLSSGTYAAKPSIPTISNAMDVGDPSNFPRMKALYEGSDEGSTWNKLKDDLVGYSYTDGTNEKAVGQIKEDYDYLADPHGAIGYLACIDFLKDHPQYQTVFLETAHPGKFLNVMEPIVGTFKLPQSLKAFSEKNGQSTLMDKSYNSFKEYLLS